MGHLFDFMEKSGLRMKRLETVPKDVYISDVSLLFKFICL